MDKISRNLIHRTEMVVGRTVMESLIRAKVIIFGIGGVGSWCAESLVRSGVIHLTIVDSDIICATNINRQLQATFSNIGKVKTDELKERLLLINPKAEIIAINRAYEPESADDFPLEDYDYVIDAIDSLRNKLLLIERSLLAGVTLYSSMGAAAKLDPTLIRVGTLAQTTVCPLAFQVRRALRRQGIAMDFQCVYSTEVQREPQTPSFCGTSECTCTLDRAVHDQARGTISPDWCARKRRINGSVAHITAIFGFMLAGLVVQDQVARCAESIPAGQVL